VLQPAFKASVAMQRTSLTVADALRPVCRLRRTMRLDVFQCPKPYEKPLAVGREAILLFLGLDKKRKNVIELKNRMYELEIVPLKATRDADGLRDEAATSVISCRTPKRQRYGRPMEKCKPPADQRHNIRLD